MRTGRASSRRASALVICLLILVLISVMLVGFFTTSRMEITASRSHVAGFEASLLAQMGVDSVRARIQNYANSNYFWVSRPGGLVVQPRGSAAPDQTPFVVDLSSGVATAETKDVSINLNPPALVNDGGLIETDYGIVMPVLWKYVTRQGNIHDSLPAYDANDPVVGRYAFWTDDESTRLNWNTAWRRTPLNAGMAHHPSRIDLTGIPGLEASEVDSIRSFRENESFFPTARSVLELDDTQLGAVARAAIHQNQFLFTHYNHSPERSLFDEPRICLTTREERAGTGMPYLDILIDETIDPGYVNNIDLDKLNAVFRRLCDFLRRTDWPDGNNLSFLQKYGESTCIQIALNIIEYVRSVESANPYVEPIKATVTGTVAAGTASITKLAPSAAADYKYLGNARGPRITEMGVHVDPTPDGDGNYACTLLVEVYNPAGSNAAIDLATLRFYRSTRLIYPFGHAQFASTSTLITAANIVNAESYTNPLLLEPGEIRVLQATVRIDKDTSNPAPPPRRFFLKAGLFSSTSPSQMIDFVPYNYTPHVEYTAVPGGDLLDIQTRAVVDPVVNRSVASWNATAANSFFSIPLGAPDGSISPQQDANAAGTAIDPVSASKSIGPASADGIVKSVAELGNIHTGLQGTLGAGIPWRTLRLQPRDAGDTSLPDWLLLDAFRAPLVIADASERSVIYPQAGSLAGRVNIHTSVAPFTNPPDRHNALRAWLLGTAPEAALANIQAQTVATGGNLGRRYGNAVFTDDGLYLTPGGIVEMNGVASQGEASETELQGILDLATVRSGVFSVFTVGQSLRQSTNGEVTIQGEHRAQTWIEQKVDGSVKVVSERSLGL